MKIRLFIFLLLALCLKGFPQLNMDIYISLTPQKEFTTTIPLRPASGAGKEVNLPVYLTWYGNDGTVKIEFRGESSEELFIYSFPKKVSYKKIEKERKDVWFDKKMVKKYMKDKTVEKGINENNLSGIRFDEPNDMIKTLEFRDPESKITCFFRKEEESCRLPMTFYVASRENMSAKSPRNKKVEYPAKFTMNIMFKEVCESPDLNRIIEYLDGEMLKMLNQKNAVIAALDSVYDLPCSKVKDLKPKIVGKEEKFTGSKDQQYNECVNLRESINDYNETLEARNDAINFYNTKLEERRQKCGGTGGTVSSAPSEDCRALYQINEKLTELLLDIKNCKQSDLAAYKQKYEKMKSGIGAGYKSCKKEYNTFIDLCSRIDKRLK